MGSIAFDDEDGDDDAFVSGVVFSVLSGGGQRLVSSRVTV